MGLRIIDRPKGRPAEITDAERLSVLTAEARHWADRRGQRQALDIQRDFIDNFRRVRARIVSPAQMADLAEKAASTIRTRGEGQGAGGDAAHDKVDVATLLELL